MRRPACLPGFLLVGFVKGFLLLITVMAIFEYAPHLHDSYQRKMQQREGRSIGAALKAYYNDHDGQWPATLDEIPPQYLKDAGTRKSTHANLEQWNLGEFKTLPPKDNDIVLSQQFERGKLVRDGWSIVVFYDLSTGVFMMPSLGSYGSHWMAFLVGIPILLFLELRTERGRLARACLFSYLLACWFIGRSWWHVALSLQPLRSDLDMPDYSRVEPIISLLFNLALPYLFASLVISLVAAVMCFRFEERGMPVLRWSRLAILILLGLVITQDLRRCYGGIDWFLKNHEREVADFERMRDGTPPAAMAAAAAALRDAWYPEREGQILVGVIHSPSFHMAIPTWEMQQALLDVGMSVVMPPANRLQPLKWTYAPHTIIIAINPYSYQAGQSKINAMVFENSWDSSHARPAFLKLEELENGEFRASMDSE